MAVNIVGSGQFAVLKPLSFRTRYEEKSYMSDKQDV